MSVTDKLLQGPAPIDRVARRVTGRGTHWAPTMKPAPHHTLLDTPPAELRPVPDGVPAAIRALVGQRRGRMTIIHLVGKTSDGNNAKWLVRCDCGNYEHRKRIQRWLAKPLDDACRECRARHFVKTGKSFGLIE